MFGAAKGNLQDMPSEGEVELFCKCETRFQPIFLVANIAHLKGDNEGLTAFPYALTVIPASKRGAIDVKTIDLIAKLDVQKMLNEGQFCYTGFDPFVGGYSLFGSLPAFLLGGGTPYEGFLDELGLVVGQYFLATEYNAADVLEVPFGLNTEIGKKNIESIELDCFTLRLKTSCLEGVPLGPAGLATLIPTGASSVVIMAFEYAGMKVKPPPVRNQPAVPHQPTSGSTSSASLSLAYCSF